MNKEINASEIIIGGLFIGTLIGLFLLDRINKKSKTKTAAGPLPPRSLDDQLAEAVKDERYEDAALLRDKIASMQLTVKV